MNYLKIKLSLISWTIWMFLSPSCETMYEDTNVIVKYYKILKRLMFDL